MKIAFIHNEKKIGTGAHYINDLMAAKLRQNGIDTKSFYPKSSLADVPDHLRGIKSILFFYSLLEHRKNILHFNIIQGTTYTALPFLTYPVPVVTHFGSTTKGFLDNTPMASNIEAGPRQVWYKLKSLGVIKELNIKTRRPLRDIADIEQFVASRATASIATSQSVKQELEKMGVSPEKIHLIHNAIEDYWFEESLIKKPDNPEIVFLGRLGNDAFTLKLKGLDRIIHLWQRFYAVPKTIVCMSANKPLINWMRNSLKNNTLQTNIAKDKIPSILAKKRGSVLFIPSRYEGFSLSLIEGMSQGLIPVSYPVGVAPEIIVNGKNGFIVHNQTEAVKRIEEILTNNTLRQKLSNQAKATAQQFTSQKIVGQLLKLYNSIADTRTKEERMLKKREKNNKPDCNWNKKIIE